MAFTFTTLTEGSSDTDGRDFTTASAAFASHPGKMFIAGVVGYDVPGETHAVEQGTCSGGGLTWTGVGGQGFTNFWLRLYRASGTGSDGALTFTGIADAGQTISGAMWIVLAIGGVDTTTNDGLVQLLAFNSLNRTTADTLELQPLSAFGSVNNANLAFFAALDTAGGATLAFTEGTGFTPVEERTGLISSDRVTLFAEYKLNDTTADASVSAANDNMMGLSIEIMYATAALTGTVTASITESDIVAGGKTIILTLTGDTWVASGATFDAQRQNIINGIDSAQSEANGWDAVVKANQGVAGVVRTSNTVVTITLDAQATYNITAQETITATIPATALTGGVAIVAAPTFTVDQVGGTVVKDIIGGYIPFAR